jgi:hypothetical protein
MAGESIRVLGVDLKQVESSRGFVAYEGEHGALLVSVEVTDELVVFRLFRVTQLASGSLRFQRLIETTVDTLDDLHEAPIDEFRALLAVAATSKKTKVAA